jgi:ATP-dependent Clp protease ATP-binding subunit ClpA
LLYAATAAAAAHTCECRLQVITLHNPSNASQPIITLQRGNGFRLFATQNPNTKFFKNKREVLSPALVNRFALVEFKQLPAAECEQVVAGQLAAGGLQQQQAGKLAGSLVAFHNAMQEKSNSSSFPEVSCMFAVSLL